MRQLFIALLTLTLSQVCIYSQNLPALGKVSYYDFIASYDIKDKGASACVLHEAGNCYFVVLDGRIHLCRNRYIRIHILKQAGIEHAEFEIPYDASFGEIDLLQVEGYTYNLGENNMVTQTPLDSKNIHDETLSDERRVKKIAMPDVREGSIIELRYHHRSRYLGLPVWQFQHDIPVLYSELQYQESPYIRYAMIFKGADKFDVYEVDDQQGTPNSPDFSAQPLNTYTYGMKNLEAFEPVDFLRNASDYIVAIYPQLSSTNMGSGPPVNYLTSWPVMRKELLADSDFGRYIRSAAKETKEVVAALNLADYDEAGKIEAIVRYVKNNYTWDDMNGKYASKSLSKFIKEKTGNAGNINLFLAGMLQTAGIESYPVILSTKPNGTVNKSYPFQALFNFVIVQAKVGEKIYYLDATDTYCPFDMVSLDCINTEGLVLKPKTEEWVTITNPHPSVTFSTMTLAIDPESGTMSGDVTRSYSGFDAVTQRKWYGGDQEKLEAKFKNVNYILKEAAAENYNNTEKPFQIKYKFETEPEESMPDKIFVNPLGHLAPQNNIFKETRRRYPIDLVSRAMDSYNVSITIPEGYTVEYLPEFKNVDTREISIVYAANVDGNTINVNAQFTFKNAVYPSSDYNLLKMYYGNMITAFSENIILSREE